MIQGHGEFGRDEDAAPVDMLASLFEARGWPCEFVAEDEIITLSHSARDRSLFARGAVAAARWVKGRPAGQYDMQDVLGLRP